MNKENRIQVALGLKRYCNDCNNVLEMDKFFSPDNKFFSQKYCIECERTYMLKNKRDIMRNDIQ